MDHLAGEIIFADVGKKEKGGEKTYVRVRRLETLNGSAWIIGTYLDPDDQMQQTEQKTRKSALLFREN